jgi:hypothetical protein
MNEISLGERLVLILGTVAASYHKQPLPYVPDDWHQTNDAISEYAYISNCPTSQKPNEVTARSSTAVRDARARATFNT